MIKLNLTRHTKAVLQALLVTFLWSTSWVMIKIGLEDLPPLYFAGLRYWLAFLCLLPVTVWKIRKEKPSRLTSGDWGKLLLLGFLFYGITQASQFLGLSYLPAVTVSVLLNFTSPLVAVIGMTILSERPSYLQWLGMILFMSGALIYFYPISFPVKQILGIGIVVVGVLANALSAVLGRLINRSETLDPMLVTVISMGFGSSLLLISGVLQGGEIRLNLESVLIIAWLAIINTAFAFTIWNQTLRSLSAIESTIINGTMLVQIALLAWFFLQESLTLREITGMVIVSSGAILVQLRQRTPR